MGCLKKYSDHLFVICVFSFIFVWVVMVSLQFHLSCLSVSSTVVMSYVVGKQIL